MFRNATKICTVICVLYFSSVLSYPADTDSLVVSSTEPSKETTNPQDVKGNEAPSVPKIYDMNVRTNVTNRFASTKIASKVKNLAKSAQEATFSVVLPDQAYITGFTMEIDGKNYEAYIQEKEQAKKTYEQAVQSGLSAGHVAVSARDSNRFTVSVNIEPQSKAVFYLTYEELLQRRSEQYEVVLNIHPGQPVKNLNVEVFINETRPLKFVKAPSLRSGNEISKNDEKLDPLADIDIINKTSATVKFSPDIEKQKQLANSLGTKEENGLAGQFIVQYDVDRDPQGGEVLVNDGYFVHFFAPSELPSLPKQVIFVLDTSGSMDGIRIRQLKEAMNSILSELKDGDSLNIVEFGSLVKVWNVEEVKIQYEIGEDPWSETKGQKNRSEQTLPGAFKATENNIKKAKVVVSKLSAYGGTDIQSALKVALELVDKNKALNTTQQPIVVFLTDGEPTVGEVNTEKIISTITELNSKKSPVFSLSFGDGADRNFLQKISLKNLGFARHIYEGADASLQLEEFYKQISSPLLTNVHFKYVSNVTEVTKTRFPIMFYGSEIVVAGIADSEFAPPHVEGWGINGPIELVPTVQRPVGSLERLWAYLSVKQILEQRDAAENKTGPTQEALRLALKYKFVTDVSSLVVVKPNSTNAVETEDASTDNRRFQSYGGIAYNKIGLTAAALPPQYFNRPVPLSGGGFGGVLTDRFVEDEDADSVPLWSTTFKPLQTTVSDDIKVQLPWLNAALNAVGDLVLSKGTYKLGLNATVTNTPECLMTPTNTTGACSLLRDCPKVFSLLTSVDVYEKYFCVLNEYAGVCCPVKGSR